jgi:dipeptidyl aminopeptidase/acylaminoacyl peptidase
MNPTPPPPVAPRWRRALFLLLLTCGPGFAFGLVFGTGQFFPDRAPAKGGPQEYGLTVQPMQYVGADGLSTRGWYIAPPSSPAPGVVLLHGYGGRRDRMLPIAKFLHKAGYGVSLMDLRSHGEAEAGVVTFGIRESQSVLPYLDDMAARPEHRDRKIGMLGCSLGAVTALKVASMDPRVAAVIADSAFDSLIGQSRWALEERLPGVVVPYFWVFTVLTGCLVTRTPPWAWEVGDWVERVAPRPMLFMHGVADARIPVACTQRLIARAGPSAESWLLDGAGHLDAMYEHASEYEARVTRFFAKHLGPQGGR